MRLTMDAAGADLLAVDLDAPEAPGDPAAGALGATGGHLYLHVDGVEVGSLAFERDPAGQLTVTLGAFDEAAEEWRPATEGTLPIEPAPKA